MTITLTPLLVIWIVRSYFPKINTERTNKQDSWWVSEDALARKWKVQLMMMMMMMKGMSLVLLIWSWIKVQDNLHIWSDGDVRGEVSGSAEVNSVLSAGNILGVSTKFHDISSNSLRDTSLWSKKCQGRVGSRIKDCYKVILIYELETLNIYINKLRRCGNISLDDWRFDLFGGHR